MKEITPWINRLRTYLQSGIWSHGLGDLKPWNRRLVVSLRVLSITLKKYLADYCFLRASALTFYSLMSVVPVAALAFAVAKGFGFQKLFEQRLMEQAAGHEEVVVQIINFSRKLLLHTQGGVLAGVGIIVLLWSVIRLLNYIEESFNDIWQVKKGRTFSRKFSDYLSIMLIAPVLLILSSSVTVFIESQAEHLTGMLGLALLNPGIAFFISLFPYVVVWLLFAFIYVFIPNIRVDKLSGIIAGFVAGTLFEVLQKVYISFQVVVANYNAVYGSFAALPLFLTWMQASWLIVLFGAEISYAFQHVDLYKVELDQDRVSHSLRKQISVVVAHRIVMNFMKKERPQSTLELSNFFGLPFPLVRSILADLCEAGIITEIVTQDQADPVYQPAHDISNLTVAAVIEALEDKGTTVLPVRNTEEFAKIEGIMQENRKILEQSSSNVLLWEI
jgi:membrane protein